VTAFVTREYLEPSKPGIRKIVSRTIGRPARRVYIPVRFHRNFASVGFAATLSQVANELLARIELRARRLVAIEIAHLTYAE
jgi:hypothetical protein